MQNKNLLVHFYPWLWHEIFVFQMYAENLCHCHTLKTMDCFLIWPFVVNERGTAAAAAAAADAAAATAAAAEGLSQPLLHDGTFGALVLMQN
jgi:hypothetical protein